MCLVEHVIRVDWVLLMQTKRVAHSQRLDCHAVVAIRHLKVHVTCEVILAVHNTARG